MTDNQGKKLIIDDDWKQEAQKEKEVLLEKEKEKQEEQPQATGAPGELPPANFSSLVSMLGTQAFYAMGFIRTHENEEPVQDLKMAKYNVDLLGILQEKTQNNLSAEEDKLLDETLQQLRMAFVQASNKPA